MLGTVDIRCGVVKVRTGGELQHETAPQLKQRKHRDIAGGNGHGTVEVFPHAINTVHVDIGNRTVAEQVDLVGLLLLLEVADCILPGPLLPGEGQVQLHQAAHLIFDPDDILAMKRYPRQADKHTIADRVFDPDLLIGIQMAQGKQHDKTQGAFVYPAPFLMLQGQRNQRAVRTDGFVQLPHNTAG